MLSVEPLLHMGLSPQQFMAACVLLESLDGDTAQASIEDVASALGSSYSTAARVVNSLVEIGVFLRPMRGVILLPQLSPVRVQTSNDVDTTLTGENSKYVQQTRVTSSHMTLALEEPNGSSNLGAAPPTTKGIHIMPISIDDGDDLGGVGMTEPRKIAPKKRPRKEIVKFHRLTPREQWDMTLVAKEFRHRLTLARPDILGGAGDGKSLTAALNKWQQDHGLTPMIAADAVDSFFDSDVVSTLKESPSPYQVFLRFLQKNYRSIARSDIDDDWLSSLDDQMEAFK